MRAVTLREAKARLNELVEAATRGEEVVLMRGSKHVAALVPLSGDDLELAPRLSDLQAERLWRRLASEMRSGVTRVFETSGDAVAFLSRRPSTRRSRRTAMTRRRRRPA